MLRPLHVCQPTSVSEASADLARLGDESKVYAGGTELILLLRLGLVHYTYLVDIKRIPALSELAWDGRMMHIGGAVTHRQLERSAAVAEHLPLLQQAAALVANVRVRNVGTLGGNLCFGDPHSDPAPVLLVHDTRVTIGKHSGGRTVGLETFFRGLYETALEPDELLVGLEVAPLSPGVGSAYLRAARFERPSLGVAVAAARHDGRLTDVRLAVSCVGPVPMRLQELESCLDGATLAEGQQLVRQAQRHYAEVLQPVDDLYGSAAYKTHLTGVLLGRALAQAVGADGRN
jgi:aerobic carbon-monoxide dehydrogenase medium subunit